MTSTKATRLLTRMGALLLTLSASPAYVGRVSDVLDETEAQRGSRAAPDIPPAPDPGREPRSTPPPDPDSTLRSQDPGAAPGTSQLTPRPAEPGLPPPPMPRPAEPPPPATHPHASPPQPDAPADPNKESEKL